MASQNIRVGTTANDNTGDTLRDAFIDIRKMFAEVYGQTYTGDTQDLSGVTLAIKENQLSVTNSPTDGYVLTYDNATGGFTWEQKFDGDITSVVAGDGLIGGASDGDATLNVNADNSTVEVVADTVRVKDLGITTAKLAADAVNGTKIADDSINSEHYVDGSIDTAHFSLTAAINVNVDQNSGTLQLWSGTQAQYDALTPDASTIYFIV